MRKPVPRVEPRRSVRARFTTRQWIMLGTPPVLTVSMYGAFQVAVRRWGMPRGWLVGFLPYWLGWCIALPLAVLGGPRGLRDLFRTARPAQPSDPRECGLLAWPLAFPLLFRFLPGVRRVGARALVFSGALGLVIGVTEEALWRGVYLRVFPDSVTLGYVYPSIAFGLWHIAPQSIAPNKAPGGAASFVLYSLLLGLSYGYYARRRGSIREVTIAHCIHDALGLSGAMLAGR
jgi:membrane protease YdiL (CAAX protease family)